ncbi:MAG TPA: hypothetical protein VJO16_03655 [Candidatus Acidoferrum sp.]|nr:hypothetical protein [Candidatus Acidoferrum sp.]
MTASRRSIPEHMDNKTALHAAARRYCEDRFSEWTQIYTELEARENVQIENKFKPGWDYSEEAYGVFPRYRVDKAIKIEVERLAPKSSNSLEELRSRLISACDIAEGRLLTEFKNEIARKALREESEECKAYIRILSEGDLLSIARLPFRRVLAEKESKELWNQLKLTWAIGEGYWFPLREAQSPPNVLAFHLDYFKAIDGLSLLHDALGQRGISRVLELHEFGPDEPDYEIELSIFEPAYRWGGEQYCTAAGLDWVVYASHESSITIGGDWLLEILKEKRPECTERTYSGPYSTNDLRGAWKWE